jgi:dynein heavy chain
LNTGEIPNLMLPEDKEEITNGVRPICNEKKIVDTMDNIANLFVDRVRELLHICLCMSPVGDSLRIRCRQFPALVNCMTLDYFSSWPEQALLDVSTMKLAELDDVTEAQRKGLAYMCMKIHRSVEVTSETFFSQLRRKVYTTPKSYLDLISLYVKVLAVKREIFQTNKNRLAIGLKKLNDTNAEIAILSANIKEMTPKLEAKNEELKVELVVVNADKEVANEKEKVVSAEAEIVNKQAQESQAIADDCQIVLDAALPQLQAAQNALKNLDSKMVTEVKGFSKIPDAALEVLRCVSLLLGDNKKEWKDI